MVISKSAYWALKAVVYLAAQRSHYGPHIAASVAAAISAPAPGTASLLRHLALAGILVSFRGLGGGFLLARDPSDITALEVCQAVGPETPAYKSDSGEGPETADSVDRLIHEISRDLELRLETITIADLALGRQAALGGAA